MLRIGAGERVDDVEIALAEVRGDLLAQTLEPVLGELRVDVAPPDPVLRARLADDELVLRRAAGVLAGVDRERAAFGQPPLVTLERMRVEHRRRSGSSAPDPVGSMPCSERSTPALLPRRDRHRAESYGNGRNPSRGSDVETIVKRLLPAPRRARCACRLRFSDDSDDSAAPAGGQREIESRDRVRARPGQRNRRRGRRDDDPRRQQRRGDPRARGRERRPNVEEETDEIAPGESADLTVDLADGEYEIYCPIDDHRSMGMEGTLVVGSGSAGGTETDTARRTPARTAVTGAS